MKILSDKWTKFIEWSQKMFARWKFFCLIVLIAAPMFACGSINDDLVDPTQLANKDLSKQDFSGKYMVGVNLSHKNLRGANFTHGDLTQADFSFSDCTGAIFNYAQLRGANFTGATLDAKWARIMDIVTTGKGGGLNLQEYDFSYIRITDADFAGANLESADLSHSMLWGGNFQNADLTNASLIKTDLLDSTLYGAKVTKEQIAGAILSCTQLPDGTIIERQKCPKDLLEQWAH